ncbi:V-type proton ATPase 116 kDa subunit a isoform 1 [Hypsibius exemplaris]|uniref:V-type proton ATPase subunit a n=1 Tax=Hypsibius exemplaris TaxID=2072580 RepID=A0A1W0WZ55_HYPEX|nr:V-type proton ATPase 116 kDa subunit a isoform 1 [Hypsibius exemplaris]
MGSLFRSQEMTLCQLFLQSEAAYACVSELGELGLVQFRDLNPDVNAFQRKFVNEIRRCDEMERILRFLDAEVRKDGIPILETGENPEAPQPREMIDLEATFEKLENEMKEINNNSEALKRNYLELSELKHILRKTQNFFDERESEVSSDHSGGPTDKTLFMNDGGGPSGASSNLGFVAGVILRERIPAFERMLWRVCRGNVFLRHTEIEAPLEDPHTGNEVYKSVFIIFFQGDQLKNRVKKICEAFRATLYPCPETPGERREMAFGVMTRIEDLTTVLGQTQDHRHRVLVAAAKNINMWFIKVHKIKAIYHTLNLFNLDVTQKCLIGECWCPVMDLDRIRLALRRGTELSGATVPSILNRMDTPEVPPTYHKTNKFTSAYQGIVDAYGISNYREVNPAPFTVITFPFLFAVMFGDLGHGLVMAVMAFFLVWKEKWIASRRIEGEIFGTIFGGRYIIFMMGLFSVYTGIIYNDIFSKSFNIFGPRWMTNRTIYQFQDHGEPAHGTLFTLDPVLDFKYGQGPYPFGLDPTWALASNKISFINSFKMKMSVILGVLQMMFGIILSCYNHLFFGKLINVFCEFIPQVLFLLCMFGYLVVLIFYKWVNFHASMAGCAPSLLIGLINMFLFKYSDNPKNNADGTPCLQNIFYDTQKSFQSFLVLLALFCVPWMLCVKPFILHRRWKASQAALPLHNVDENGHAEGGKVQASHGGGHDDHGDGATFDFGNIIIYQAIHTIEFCLGIISNTASYLRLWALSLAHSQLSEVLWNMVMKFSFNINGWGGIPLLFFLFAAWSFLTLAILVMMEGMSAFLHALRLHWVEFQNKFYGGQGYQFQPFSFATMTDGNKPVDE